MRSNTLDNITTTLPRWHNFKHDNLTLLKEPQIHVKIERKPRSPLKTQLPDTFVLQTA